MCVCVFLCAQKKLRKYVLFVHAYNYILVSVLFLPLGGSSDCAGDDTLYQCHVHH